ncbi:methyltransferase domain-containing protein [Thermofilum pendens]|uniref:Methyltransferase type 11 n=1 Tax=Thermofilum pendens (strain DSM 2475 / Hrk 5) TaxID=368408 RepID=A1RXI7_THEPD|nr:methyltransferase domain-containing protein [Thermofilum pendens]ABL77917.1 Methyltransferase type 11 [Thermofilum pendens Hrk 5]
MPVQLNVDTFAFRRRKGFVLSPVSAVKVLESPTGEFELPVDIGLGIARAVKTVSEVSLNLEGATHRLTLGILERLAGSDKLLYVGPEGVYFVEVRDEKGYYKLKYLGERVAPTLEINGVHMHNITGIDPLSDAERKVRMLGVARGEKVLDVCTGLGYTAIRALERGAEVVSIEKDPNVLYIAEHNPFSEKLSRASILLGDAFDVVGELPEEYFDKVLHDPPVFAFAGHLYSAEFYTRLWRVLKKGGRVFHYTGAPGKHRGVNIQRGVVERLRRAGFRIVRVIKDYGVIAEKPRRSPY